MPRQKRSDEAGVIYHALNRGNERQKIFRKDENYDALVRVLHEGLKKYQVELFSFALMPNHWHLVLRPAQDGQMGRLHRWVTATHTLRCHGRMAPPRERKSFRTNRQCHSGQAPIVRSTRRAVPAIRA